MPLEAGALLLDAVGLGWPLWWLAGHALAALLWLAHLVASAPGAVAALPAMPAGAFGLMVAGGLWIALWRTRARRLGLLPAVLGAAWAVATPPADLVVTGLVVIAALLAAGGLLTAVRRRPKPAPFPLSPAEPPVTGRALAQIALPGPRRAEATESGAYRITDSGGITDTGGTGPFPRTRRSEPMQRVPAGRHST